VSAQATIDFGADITPAYDSFTRDLGRASARVYVQTGFVSSFLNNPERVVPTLGETFTIEATGVCL